MTVPKMLIGATIGMLVSIAGAVIVWYVIIEGGGFADTQRLIVAIVLQLVVMLVIMAMIERPGPRRPLTWPMAMLGAVAVAGVSLLAFGSVPHEWITFADAELNWGRRDLVMFDLPGVIPFDISRMAVRDIIEAGMYTQSFAAALGFWLLWQRRHQMAEEKEQALQAREERRLEPAGTSAYGRPLAREK